MSPVRFFLTALDSSAPESTKPKGGSMLAGMLATKRTMAAFQQQRRGRTLSAYGRSIGYLHVKPMIKVSRKL